MLKVPFDMFLAKSFCQYFEHGNFSDCKFHYVCPNEEHANYIYDGFSKLGFNELIIKDTAIRYITISNQNVLIMLHGNNSNSKYTYHEDFIAAIRDEINLYPGHSLLVIHNSTLDTILSTCSDLTSKDSVFTPKYICCELMNLLEPDECLSSILLERRKKIIELQNRSIFAFKNIYECITDEDINLTKEDLFSDDRLKGIDNKKDLEGAIKGNEYLFNKISSVINESGKLNIPNALEDMNLSEGFIKEYFPSDDLEKWKTLTFGQVEAEIDKNKKRTLELQSVSVNGEICETYKHLADKGAGNRNVSILAEIDSESDSAVIKLFFSRGAPALTKDQLRCKNKNILFNVHNNDNKTIATITIPYHNGGGFEYIKLVRGASKEQYKINILIVRKGFLNLPYYFSSISLSAEKKNGLILLDYGAGYINVCDDENLDVLEVSEQNQVISFGNLHRIDYHNIIEEVDVLSFSLTDGIQEVRFQIVGGQYNEKIILPAILDPARNESITDRENQARYIPISRKVIVKGRERGLSVDAQILCEIEARFISENIVYEDRDTGLTIHVDEIESDDIRDVFEMLYTWLRKHQTIPSLANWSPELSNIVEKLVYCFELYYSKIDEGALSNKDKSILKIGSYVSGEKEWLTPFHPLCLAYCLELLSNFEKDETHSFKDIADVTLERLSPSGLLPIVNDNTENYYYSTPHSQNPLWVELVSQKNNNYSFVGKLVSEKIYDFMSCFKILFENENKKLLINSINNGNNAELFNGVVTYLYKNRDRTQSIHVNIYNEGMMMTMFDMFSKEDDITKAREIIFSKNDYLSRLATLETCDDIISLFREKVTYSKFENSSSVVYSHITFFRNNKSVIMHQANVNKSLSGIFCDGLISGETSYHENGVYYTGFGLRNIEDKNSLVNIALYYNQLLGPARSPSAKYNKNMVPVLAVHDKFKKDLNLSYKNSMWTCIIDPKVTLDFFKGDDTVLIHYSDKYTSSSSYDAITVTENLELYKGLLKNDSEFLINSFNAINGQWLLNIMKEASTSTKYNNIQSKEKNSIVAAYKLISALTLKSDIVWIPMSMSELLRVAKNTGLSIGGSDFSASLNNYKGGPLSDDIIFVGYKENSICIIPVEVKAREKGSDISKAIKQLKALSEHLTNSLAAKNFKSKILRSLFVQQIFSQVERYKLYRIYPDSYFKDLEDGRELLIQGDYAILSVKDYPNSMVVEFNNSLARVSIDVDYGMNSDIAVITLPMSFFNTLHSESIEELATRFSDNKNHYSLIGLVIVDSSIIGDDIYLKTMALENTDDSHHSVLSSSYRKKDNSDDIFCSYDSVRVSLGNSLDIGEEIYWEYNSPELSNRHIVIFGSSGKGKTYCIQSLLMELSAQGIGSLVVDYTNGFLSNHLEDEFKVSVNPTSHIVAVDPFKLSPFKRQVMDIGEQLLVENDFSIASRISSTFKKMFTSTGEQQFPLLTSIIESGVRKHGDNYNFNMMSDDLYNQGKSGELIANKISPFIRANLFDSVVSNVWSSFFDSTAAVSNIIQLTTIPSVVAHIATEFILWDLYSYACANGNKRKPLPIVLDEVQNLDLSIQSPLGKILTEGRKYGFSLILATQTLSTFSKDEQDRLFLAGHKLFFSPAETEMNTYAKILEQVVPGSTRKDWIKQLARLKKGECISVGLYKNSKGNYQQRAIVIKISPLKVR